MGLESTYWCETYTEALEYLNANAQAGDTVWVDPWSHDVMVYYQMHGRLRHDVYISVPHNLSLTLFEQESCSTNGEDEKIASTRLSVVFLPETMILLDIVYFLLGITKVRPPSYILARTIYGKISNQDI